MEALASKLILALRCAELHKAMQGDSTDAIANAMHAFYSAYEAANLKVGPFVPIQSCPWPEISGRLGQAAGCLEQALLGGYQVQEQIRAALDLIRQTLADLSPKPSEPPGYEE